MENQNIGNANTIRTQYVRLTNESLVENCAREEELTTNWSLERKLKQLESVKLRLRTKVKELETKSKWANIRRLTT